MSDAQGPPQDQLAQAIYIFAAGQMKQGKSNAQIEQVLMNRGLPAEAARTVVQNLSRARAEALRKAAVRNMAVGGAFCLIGLLVTASTYAAASGPGGGTYLVAWGAILFGAIQFLRGLSSYHRA